MSKKSIGSKIGNIIFTIVVLLMLFKIYGVYKTYNFNDFIKAEQISGATRFTRDNNVKSSYEYSYKLESIDFNDAMFYKTIKVKKNTPYKLTCKVKTENVENKSRQKQRWCTDFNCRLSRKLKKHCRNE